MTSATFPQELDNRSVSIGSVRKRVQMNSCFICNNVFVADSNPGNIGLLGTLFTILDVTLLGTSIPERNPLCSVCRGKVDEYQNLERQLQFIIRMLWELRRMLGKSVVEGFKDTKTDRKNFGIKSQISEVWSQRVNARYSQVSSSQIFNFYVRDHHVSTPTSTAAKQGQAEPVAESHPSISSKSVKRTQRQAAPLSGNNANTNDDTGGDFGMDCPSPSSPFNDAGAESDMDASTNLPLGEMTSITAADENTPTSSSIQKTIDGPTEPGKATKDTSLAQALEPESVLENGKARPIIVTNRRNHACKFCGKLFPTRFSLEMHERIHTGDRPFSCSICGRPFLTKSSMQKHAATHDKSRYAGEPKHECKTCGKKYHLANSLTVHEREVHQGIRPIRMRKNLKKKNPKDISEPNSSVNFKEIAANITAHQKQIVIVTKQKSATPAQKTVKLKEARVILQRCDKQLLENNLKQVKISPPRSRRGQLTPCTDTINSNCDEDAEAIVEITEVKEEVAEMDVEES